MTGDEGVTTYLMIIQTCSYSLHRIRSSHGAPNVFNSEIVDHGIDDSTVFIDGAEDTDFTEGCSE